MLQLGEHFRLLGVRGGSGGGRRIHLSLVQDHAVRRELDATGGRALVLGADRWFRGGVSVAGAGRSAVDGYAAAGSCDAAAPVQVGGLIRSTA